MADEKQTLKISDETLAELQTLREKRKMTPHRMTSYYDDPPESNTFGGAQSDEAESKLDAYLQSQPRFASPNKT